MNSLLISSFCYVASDTRANETTIASAHSASFVRAHSTSRPTSFASTGPTTTGDVLSHNQGFKSRPGRLTDEKSNPEAHRRSSRRKAHSRTYGPRGVALSIPRPGGPSDAGRRSSDSQAGRRDRARDPGAHPRPDAESDGPAGVAVPRAHRGGQADRATHSRADPQAHRGGGNADGAAGARAGRDGSPETDDSHAHSAGERYI